jgi:acyl-CoA synthetase (AMP-forming)/AMP-acid ligase II/acyl carrier protein
MWFLYKLEPNSGYYNINHQRIINGDLDITLFKKALSLIVKKNKILLVNFKIVNNLPVQFINHKGNIDLKFYDIEKIPGNKKEVLDNLIKKNNNKNFTLEKDLLIKFSLFKISKYKFIFLLNVHHIVFDLWSVDIFLKELFIIYDDLINKRNKIFLVNKYDYFDYISLESSIKNKNKIKKYEKYWLKVFDKTELTINFPVDRLRFSAHYFSGGIERITIEKKIVDKIKKFCKDFNMTIFTFLFSSYNIFLYRLIRNKNIVVGIPISDRDSLELENIIGFLVNTLAIKTSIKEEDSFIVFLGKVKDILFEAYQNKNYPFDELVKKINPKRNSNTLNILSTMFVFDPMYKRNFKIGEINLKYRSTYSNVNKFDLKLRAKETEEGDIMLIYEYNKNLFFSETINNYLVNIKSIIKNVVKDKNIKIKDIPLMEKKDSIKVIKKINSTKEVTCSKTIIDVFLEMTKKYKNKIAIQCENKKITYNNLLKKAMRLADVLDGKIDTSVPICILTDRREGLPVAIFSVLLLGGSFYLIDKDTNSEIIKRIISLNKTKSILGIGSNKFKSKKFNYFDINEIVKEKNDNEGVDRVREFLRFSPKKSAAIVYTSGSTGDSKGVILSHESILNNIKQRVKIAKLSHKDTLSFNAYTEFISSPLQLLLPFMIGAKLMMYQKEIIRNPLKLFNNINKDMVTAFEIGAYGMELYVDVIRKKREKKLPLKFLRTIWSSGAKTSTNSLNYFCNAYPQKKVIIGYGCSEYSMILNNVYKGNKKIEKVLEGKPTINTEVYILDKNMKILPPGYEGELCVSGKGMCSQYLDKKSKHKKSFLSHPFIKGEKIYKTGDLAKMDFKGNIEILGRIDNQINLRGFRIEPSNIEYNLRTIKGIKESAVILKKDLLIAFYESDNNKKIDNKKIRNYLIKKIPDYMLPSLFLHINKIPHTKSGKLDKKSLINIENIFQKKYSDFKKVTKTEEKLINIWKKTIEVKKISRNDNFFYLGGHSLKAILIMVKINEIFKIDISLKDIFSFPRLKDLACKIDSIRINKMNIKKQEIKKAKGRIYSTR